MLGLCSGWGGICGVLIANVDLICYWRSIRYHKVIEKHGIIYMYVVNRSTLMIMIKCKFMDKFHKIWLLEHCKWK